MLSYLGSLCPSGTGLGSANCSSLAEMFAFKASGLTSHRTELRPQLNVYCSLKMGKVDNEARYGKLE